MLHQFITPHDAFQDGLLLFTLLVAVTNSVVLLIHLHQHKVWREQEDERTRHTGALHGN